MVVSITEKESRAKRQEHHARRSRLMREDMMVSGFKQRPEEAKEQDVRITMCWAEVVRVQALKPLCGLGTAG